MRAERLVALLAVSLAAAASLAGHGLAYLLAEPHSHARAELLAHTGHGHLEGRAIAISLAVVGAAAFIGLVLVGRARPGRPQCGRAVVLVGPLAFLLQESLERLVSNDGLGVELVTEPAFVLGLALQVPLAVVALVAARALVRAAVALGRALSDPRPAARPRRRAGVQPVRSLVGPWHVAFWPPAAGRAPPAAA